VISAWQRLAGEFEMRAFRLALVASVFFGLTGSAAFAGKKPTKPAKPGELPAFDTVMTTVQQHLAGIRSYQSGDLLTTSMVEPIFAVLAKIDWEVADHKEIIKSILSDRDWLARQLQSRQGKAFMRDVADLPSSFETLDRLRHETGGQRQVMEMINSEDGSKTFERLTSTPSARHARRVRRHGSGDNDLATARIYTELELLKRLKKSYEKELARRALTQPADSPDSPDAAPAGSQPKQPYDPFKTPHG
jgi:hypothetical protein